MKNQYVQGTPLFTYINKNEKQYSYLTEDLDTEVCIIGGGVTGAIALYYLTKNNIKGTLIEKKRVAHLSTSVTTSLLQYELDDNLSELKKHTTLENGVKSYKLGLKALDEIKEFIESEGNKCDYVQRDTILYTAKKDEEKELKKEYDLRVENGFNVEYLNAQTNRYSFDLKGAVVSKSGGAEIDPYKFTHHLLQCATRDGGKVYENTEVVKLNHHENYIDVITEYGYKIRAKKVIVATGYNTELFSSRSFGTKTTTFNVVSKPVKALLGWEDRILIRDNCNPYNYLRTTKDNRLIIGGEDVSFIPDIFNEKLANEKYSILENRLKSMFKDIKDIEIEFKYCGAFASTPDNLGFVGPDNTHRNLWFLLGYGANGILFAVLGAMMLCDLYNGKENKAMKLFKVNRF